MPSYYRTNNYVVNDYSRYGLRAPPRGSHYVRSGNDVVLAVVRGFPDGNSNADGISS